METREYFEQIVSGKELSCEQKIAIIKEMVTPKVHKALEEHVVISKATGEDISFTVITDSNQDIGIQRYLKVIGATDVDISSKNESGTDMGGYREDRVRTKVQFKI